MAGLGGPTTYRPGQNPGQAAQPNRPAPAQAQPYPAPAPAPAPQQPQQPIDTSKTYSQTTGDRPQAFPYYSKTGQLLGYRLGSADSSRVITPQQYTENYLGAPHQQGQLGGAGSPLLGNAGGGGGFGGGFGFGGGIGGGGTAGLPGGSVATPNMGFGGTGSAGSNVPAFDPLSIKANPSPEMAQALSTWQGRMGDIQSGLQQRMSTDTTQRAIDQAAGSIRSQAAGMSEGANAAGAQTGRGPGYGAAGIGDSAQAAQAKAAANIELGRQQQLDNLFLGGQGALNQAYGQNPFSQTAQLGLQQQGLGLQAYLGQLQAQNQTAQTQAMIEEAKARIYGTPMQWYQTMLGAL